MAESSSCQLCLIGGFELCCNGSAHDLPEAAKRLVAFLALHPKPQVRTYVSGSLWPDKPESRAAANLRSALWRLHDPGVPDLVRCDGSVLWLDESVRTDVRWLHQVGWQLLERDRDPPPAGSERSGAVEGGPVGACELASEKDLLFEQLLPGWYDDWVLLERERLAELQLHLLDLAVEELVAQQRFPQAIDAALRMVAADPFRERSQVALVRAYLAEGSLGRARRQYEVFDQLLHLSFGLGFETSFEALRSGSAR